MIDTRMAGPDVRLVTSRKELMAVRRALGITKAHSERPQWADFGTAAGVTWSYEVDGQPVWIVGLDKEQAPLAIVATLVHESVHVWQGWKRFIGESEPSAEFEAYSIESISTALIRAYADSGISPV